MISVKKLHALKSLCRSASSSPSEFINRNPRNLERMRIARKPDGFHLDNPGRKFWHKLQLTTSNRTVKAEVVHFINGPVIEASTSEWALRKQLYSSSDMCAYINLGKVFAQRCNECGISEMYCNITPSKGGKVEKFLDEVVKNGVKLQEMEVYKKPNPWDQFRPEKPWEVTEE